MIIWLHHNNNNPYPASNTHIVYERWWILLLLQHYYCSLNIVVEFILWMVYFTVHSSACASLRCALPASPHIAPLTAHRHTLLATLHYIIIIFLSVRHKSTQSFTIFYLEQKMHFLGCCRRVGWKVHHNGFATSLISQHPSLYIVLGSIQQMKRVRNNSSLNGSTGQFFVSASIYWDPKT